ncbi:MAG: hypothetical protein WC634_01765 [archaeon]
MKTNKRLSRTASARAIRANAHIYASNCSREMPSIAEAVVKEIAPQ